MCQRLLRISELTVSLSNGRVRHHLQNQCAHLFEDSQRLLSVIYRIWVVTCFEVGIAQAVERRRFTYFGANSAVDLQSLPVKINRPLCFTKLGGDYRKRDFTACLTAQPVQ